MTDDELLEILNASLSTREACPDVRFTGRVTRSPTRDDGCNWDGRALEVRGPRVPLACYAAAREVIEDARRRYRLR